MGYFFEFLKFSIITIMILLDCFLKSDRIAAIRKAFLTLIIVLLPLTANSFVRKFVVTNTLFVEQPVGQPPYVVSGSLAAAVDSVNKYYWKYVLLMLSIARALYSDFAFCLIFSADKVTFGE